MIPWNNESVWLDALPQNKTVSRWPVFHGSVILPYILKAIWCINMILWANKSVWLDAWPQNKSWSLWPIFHGSVAYILKTILYIRRWHWPGVYVSPCSLALVANGKDWKQWTNLCSVCTAFTYCLLFPLGPCSMCANSICSDQTADSIYDWKDSTFNSNPSETTRSVGQYLP